MQKLVDDTLDHIASIILLFFISVLINLIPLFAFAGSIEMLTLLPECKPTPLREKLFCNVCCFFDKFILAIIIKKVLSPALFLIHIFLKFHN